MLDTVVEVRGLQDFVFGYRALSLRRLSPQGLPFLHGPVLSKKRQFCVLGQGLEGVS